VHRVVDDVVMNPPAVGLEVQIDAEGEEDAIKNFTRTIANANKGMILVSDILVRDKELHGYSHFTIRRD